MTLLEKILWLADYIEPTRAFFGLEQVRNLAYTDLDAAMRLALTMSLRHMEGRGEKPHPATAEALGYLRGGNTEK